MPRTIQVETSTGSSTHVISLHGVSGSILWCTFAAFVFYLIAFVTENWAEVHTDKGNVNFGLWQACLCQPGLIDFSMQAWFRSSQAMLTMGLFALSGCLVLIVTYMFIHSISKNRVIKIYLWLSFCTVTFMLIAFVIFGIYTTKHRAMQGFSFGCAIIACVLCGVAIVLTCIQMRRSETCGCCSCCCAWCKCCRNELAS